MMQVSLQVNLQVSHAALACDLVCIESDILPHDTLFCVKQDAIKHTNDTSMRLV